MVDGIQRQIGFPTADVNDGKGREGTVVFGQRLALAALGLAIALLSGCATTQVQTAAAAERLERRADTFVGHFCHETVAVCRSNRYLPTARGFANQAHRFRRTVESGSDQQVVLSFKRLWRKYHALRDKICRSRDLRFRADFKPTTQAFRKVQLLVENGYSYADPTVYAMGGYTLDPYYN